MINVTQCISRVYKHKQYLIKNLNYKNMKNVLIYFNKNTYNLKKAFDTYFQS